MANYPTLDSNFQLSNADISEGGLRLRATANNGACMCSTTLPSTGKYYFECHQQHFDLAPSGSNNYIAIRTFLPDGSEVRVSEYRGNGTIYRYDTTVGSSYPIITEGDFWGCAINCDDLEVNWYKNGTLIETTSHSSDLDSFEGSFIGIYMPRGASSYPPGDTAKFNFGQLPWKYEPPTGYSALTVDNFPEPPISPLSGETPEDYFKSIVYTGDETDNRDITVGFQPDLVWIKNRGQGYAHYLFDSVRGAGKRLITNSNGAETDDATSADELQAFNADGFQVGTNIGVNDSGVSHVAWCWKAGGTAVSNTDGNITSQVSANTKSGFSIITYSGSGISGATVGHGLSKAPEYVIIKVRTQGDNWAVSNPTANRLYLNGTTAASSIDYNFVDQDSTVLTLNGTDAFMNSASNDYVAYCWHSVEGFSKVGTYTGNGSVNGTYVPLGFKPAFVMIKQKEADNWVIFDNKRDPENTRTQILKPNDGGAESAEVGAIIDFYSNGFKLKGDNAAAGVGQTNKDTKIYSYIAFAEMPQKYSLGG